MIWTSPLSPFLPPWPLTFWLVSPFGQHILSFQQLQTKQLALMPHVQ